ncbi:MAG: glutaredoxin family protein [Chloroflexota bacterium]
MQEPNQKRYTQVTMYGRTGCKDTDWARSWFQDNETPFEEVNIDHDPLAEAFVRVINDGERKTPTIVVGSERMKTVLSVPDEPLLESVVRAIPYPGPDEFSDNPR